MIRQYYLDKSRLYHACITAFCPQVTKFGEYLLTFSLDSWTVSVILLMCHLYAKLIDFQTIIELAWLQAQTEIDVF